MLSVTKPVSLVQQKKQQWAREREEMSHLYLPWGSGERYTNRLTVRNQFASSLELHKQSYEYSEPIQRQRSPSLPPIHNIDISKTIADDKITKEVLNRNVPSSKRFAFYDEDAEGDTSGYGSETVNHKNTKSQNGTLRGINHLSPELVVAWQQEERDNKKKSSSERSGMTDGAWSARSSGAEEGRPRWGDRGVATGRLWEPTAPTARLPQMPNQNKGTPAWVERGLNMIENASEVLLIDQRSSNSGLDFDKSSYNGSDEGRTYLRGQNVPIEPEIKAQRETKRLKALELQNVILNQLEEREKRKQEEREEKLREERLEELRIHRQREEDRIRLEEEKRRNEEKQKLEQRKLDTLKKALEDAEKKAKQEKEKKFHCHKQAAFAYNENETNVEDNKTFESVRFSPKKIVSPSKSSRTYDVHSAQSVKKDNTSQPTSTYNSPRSVTNGNLNLFIHNVPPLKLADNQFNIVPIGITGSGEIINGQTNTIQLAVLVPQNLNNNYYSVSVNSNDSSDMGKILTPRKYRELKTKDVATQTDSQLFKNERNNTETVDDIERCLDKEYSNIDENAPQESHRNPLKKERRLRSEERFKKEIENRPKWGANRPQAQYKKQSEKDPFYTQKRRLRHKHRPQMRQYLSHSSEDSRSPSPPTRSDKNSKSNLKQRNSLSQSYWKNKLNSQDAQRINNEFETEINVPDFISLSQITKTEKYDHKPTSKLSPNKRITLSQKFINDKYGSRKLWQEDTNEKISKYSDIEIPKKM